MSREVQVSTVVALPQRQAWALLSDLELADRYVPGVQACQLTSRKRQGIGASRRVELRGRPPMQETVESWDEGIGFTLRLHRTTGNGAPPPFVDARFSCRLQGEGPKQTRVHLQLAYALRGGLIGQLLDRLVVKRTSQSQLDRLAANLKTFYESQGRR